MSNLYAKAGAILYLIWGVAHLDAARRVYELGQTFDPGMVQGRMYQSAWGLLFFAVVAIGVAVFLNWKNSRTGYWINLITVSVADIGFIAFILIPGYVPFLIGLLGPIMWLAAAMLTTLGLRSGGKDQDIAEASASPMQS